MPPLVNVGLQKCPWSLSMWEQGLAKAAIPWHSAVCCWPPSVPWAFQVQAGMDVVLREHFHVHSGAILNWV